MEDNSFIVATLDIILVFVYLLLCLIIGLFASRRDTTAEFLIAGRKLSLWRFVSTYVASAIGGGTLIAYSAFIYKFGMSAAWGFVGYCGMIALFTFYARKIRAIGRKEDWHTLPDFFYARHGHAVGITVSILILFTSLLLLIGQLIAGAMVLCVATGWPYLLSLLLGTIVVIIYLLLGGFNAVVITDIFQYVLMVFLTVVIGVSLTVGTTFLPSQLDPVGTGGSIAFGLALFGAVAVVISPEVWQRVYAAKDDRTIRWGMPISALFIAIIAAGLTSIVMVTRVKYPGIMPEESIAYGLVYLLPSVVRGFGLVLLFATIMSSADTWIFALSTIVSKNILRHHEKLKRKDFKKVTQGAVFGVTMFAGFMAYSFPNIVKIYTLVANVVFSLAPATIASFHWKLKSKAILFSIGAGVATLLFFIILGDLKPEVAAVSFFMSLVFLVIGERSNVKSCTATILSYD
jgi:SSS family solute:Na+ symporter